jgi:hypothetical protein
MVIRFCPSTLRFRPSRPRPPSREGESCLVQFASVSSYSDKTLLEHARIKKTTSTGTSEIPLDATAGPWFDEEAPPRGEDDESRWPLV